MVFYFFATANWMLIFRCRRIPDTARRQPRESARILQQQGAAQTATNAKSNTGAESNRQPTEQWQRDRSQSRRGRLGGQSKRHHHQQQRPRQ